MSQSTEADASPFQNNATPPLNPVVRREALHPDIIYRQGNKKGILIIFNHYEVFPYERNKPQPTKRNGTEVDLSNLKKCFRNLDFEIKDYTEPTHVRILRVLNEVAEADHTNTGCIVVVVMTHGDADDLVLAADKKYHVSDLWKKFEEARNPTLFGKPKLFFIQACRGQAVDEGDIVTDASSFTGAPIKIPTRADYLIMYSTVEDSAAFREQGGSWFISILCQEIHNHAGRDLLEILTSVNRRIAYEKYTYNPNDASLHDKKQMPQIVSMLTKHWYFY